MTSEAYVKAQNGAVRLAVRDLRRYWASLDLSDGVGVRVALEAYWPRLLATYGEITATLAADRFEELVGLPATMVRPVDAERANARMRWAIGPLFGIEGDAIARMLQLTDELVKQPGRSTTIRSATENRIRFARVPTGAETCNWCLMLGGRGAVYRSARNAGQMSSFHPDCDCRVEPVRSDDDLNRLRDTGYDPDALFAQYLATTSAS